MVWAPAGISGIASFANRSASQYSASEPAIISVPFSYVLVAQNLQFWNIFPHAVKALAIRIKVAAMINFLFIPVLLHVKYTKLFLPLH